MKKSVRKIIIVINCVIFFTLMMGMTALSSDKTVSFTADKWYSSDGKFYDTTYFKISIPQDGYITVQSNAISDSLKKEFSVNAELCDSKMNSLQRYNEILSTRNPKTYYGVKKGIYYIKVTGREYRLKYSFKSVSDRSGKTKSKAKNISRSKTVKGLVIANEKNNQIDWYKFVLKKPQKISFTFGAYSNFFLSFKVTTANTKSSKYSVLNNRTNSTRSIKKWWTFPAGVYYIQVSRLAKSDSWNPSGYYTIKWK